MLIALAVCGLIIFIYVLKKCKIKYFLLSAFSGLAALFAADLIGRFFEFNLPLNAFTVTLGALGGLPGVILVNLLNIIFR